MSKNSIELPKHFCMFNSIASGKYQNGQKIEEVGLDILSIINRIMYDPEREYMILTEENNFICYIDQFMLDDDINKLCFPLGNLIETEDCDDRSDMSEPDEELLIHHQFVNTPNTKTSILYAFIINNSDCIVSMSYTTENKAYRGVLYSRYC